MQVTIDQVMSWQPCGSEDPSPGTEGAAMRVYIITLQDEPTGDNALTSCGAPLTFRTKEIGEDGRKHLLTRDKRDKYVVEPAILLTRRDQLKVKVTAPEGVQIDVLTQAQRSPA